MVRARPFFFPEYSVVPTTDWAREWRRPWKLFTFAVGMAWLIWGAITYQLSDWDIGVSLAMGLLTYLLAPWSVCILGGALIFRRTGWPWHVLLALATGWFVVDGVYVGYNVAMGHAYVREANAWASAALYLLAGFIWLYRGAALEFASEVRSAIQVRRAR